MQEFTGFFLPDSEFEVLEPSHSGVLHVLGLGVECGMFSTALPWIGGIWRYPAGANGVFEVSRGRVAVRLPDVIVAV